MNRTSKYVKVTFAFLFLLLPSFVSALSTPDINKIITANRIFDEAEKQFPQYLSPQGAKTDIYQEWIYRYYSDTDMYAGINDKDEVYLLVDGNLVYQGTVPEIQNLLGISTYFEIGEDDPGSGDCVTVNLHPVGLKVRYKTSYPDTNTEPTYQDFTFLDRSETIGVVRIVSTDHGNTNDMLQQDNGYVSDGMFYLESTDVTTTHTFITAVESPIVTVTKMRYEYSPPNKIGPLRNFCNGQIWYSDSVSKETINSDSIIPPGFPKPNPFSTTLASKSVVEATNENVTTPFGQVNTLRYRKVYSDGTYSIQWNSIEYGVPVRGEVYGPSGKLYNISEAQTLELPDTENDQSN